MYNQFYTVAVFTVETQTEHFGTSRLKLYSWQTFSVFSLFHMRNTPHSSSVVLHTFSSKVKQKRETQRLSE